MKKRLTLSNGFEVELYEVTNENDGISNSNLTEVQVYDPKKGEVLCQFKGHLPNFDEDGFDIKKYLNHIETEICIQEQLQKFVDDTDK